MAGNDSINIDIGDGNTIAVPKWAQEITADTIVNQLKLGNKFQKDLLKNLTDLTIDVKDFEKELTGIFQRLKRRQEEITEQENKNRRQFAKQLAKDTAKIVDDLSDTSQPLTKMTELTGDFTKALGGLSGGMLKDGKSLGGMGALLKKVAPGLNLAGDALLAYVGFQAGRIEQFAAAQKSMIDAGAIYYESAAEFDQLYKNATAAGITYTQLANIASGYGTALQSLGTGVSSGVKQFSEFFKDINETSDKFGDFGLSSESLASTYAEYIDTQRLTGSINRDTIRVQDKLRQGFQELMLETTALSSLTGKNRNELLQRQMAALKDPRNAAALIRMRESGLNNQASAAEEIIKQFASGTDEFGQVGVTLSNALAEELSTTKDNIQDFDITDVLRQTDPVLMNVLQEHAPDFLSGINEAVQTGQISGENLNTFVYDEFMKMRTALEGEDIFQGAVGPSNEYAQMVIDLQNVAILTEKTFGNVRDMTDEELAKFQARTAKNLGEAGQATVAVNDLITTFLEVQNALTYPLNKSADMAESLSGFLKSALDRLKGAEDDDENEIESTTSKQAEGFAAAEKIAEEQGISPEEVRKSDPAFDSMGLGVDDILPYDPEAIETAIQQGMTKEVIMSPTLGKEIIILRDESNELKFEARKAGGPIKKGETYLVGEQGPEFIEPGMEGNVTSFSKTTDQIKAREAELSSMLDTLKQTFDLFGGVDGAKAAEFYNSGGDIGSINNEKFRAAIEQHIQPVVDSLDADMKLFMENGRRTGITFRGSGDRGLMSADYESEFDSIPYAMDLIEKPFKQLMSGLGRGRENLSSDAELKKFHDSIGGGKARFKSLPKEETPSVHSEIGLDAFGGEGAAVLNGVGINERAGANSETASVSPNQVATPKIKSETDVSQGETSNKKDSVDIENMMTEYNEIKKNQLEVIKRFKTLMKSVTKSQHSGGHPTAV